MKSKIHVFENHCKECSSITEELLSQKGQQAQKESEGEG